MKVIQTKIMKVKQIENLFLRFSVQFGVDSFMPFPIHYTDIYMCMKFFPTFYKNNILHMLLSNLYILSLKNISCTSLPIRSYLLF